MTRDRDGRRLVSARAQVSAGGHLVEGTPGEHAAKRIRDNTFGKALWGKFESMPLKPWSPPRCCRQIAKVRYGRPVK